MADTLTPVPQDSNQSIPPNVDPQHHGILDQTLGDVLKNNPQAQGMVMQAMRVSPEKFQQLLTMTDNNALMNTKIKDLFSSGIVQQALSQQGQNTQQVVQIDPNQLELTPEQKAQLQAQAQGSTTNPLPQQSSWMDKIKSLFK